MKNLMLSKKKLLVQLLSKNQQNILKSDFLLKTKIVRILKQKLKLMQHKLRKQV